MEPRWAPLGTRTCATTIDEAVQHTMIAATAAACTVAVMAAHPGLLMSQDHGPARLAGESLTHAVLLCRGVGRM